MHMGIHAETHTHTYCPTKAESSNYRNSKVVYAKVVIPSFYNNQFFKPQNNFHRTSIIFWMIFMKCKGRLAKWALSAILFI